MLLYHLIHLFKSLDMRPWIFLFLKGTLHNLQNKIQRINPSTISDCLENSRCCSFFCVCVIPDYVKICMVKTPGISSFWNFGHAIGMYYRIVLTLYCNSRSHGGSIQQNLWKRCFLRNFMKIRRGNPNYAAETVH